MSHRQERAEEKTDAELCQEYPNIEPEYTRCGAIAERVMARFEAEHFQPIVKKVSDHVSEHLWDLLRDHLLTDTEVNLGSEMRHRVERTIQALLSGESWALQRYVLGSKYQDGQVIREAIAKLIPVELQEARVKDLEKELAETKQQLAAHMRRSAY